MKNTIKMNLEFTGEFVVPDVTPYNIWQDHIERYKFACESIRNHKGIKKVLDLGCGTGYGSALMSDEDVEVWGIDKSEQVIKYAKEKWIEIERLHFINKNILYAKNLFNFKFDLIICFEVIEHIEAYEAVLQICSDLLIEKGILIISTPNREIVSPGNGLNDRPLNTFHTQEFILPDMIYLLKKVNFRIKGVYGQRQCLLKPERLLKSEVQPLIKLDARYYTLVAEKK